MVMHMIPSVEITQRTENPEILWLRAVFTEIVGVQGRGTSLNFSIVLLGPCTTVIAMNPEQTHF